MVRPFSSLHLAPNSGTKMSMNFDLIQVHLDSRVAEIVLCRPPLNVINIPMMLELNRAWDAIEASPVDLVVITSKGERGFSAGVDVADHSPEKAPEMLRCFHQVLRRIYHSDCISVASIWGYTLGGAAELAMICDFVVAADDLQFGYPEIDVGCYPPVAAMLLPRIVGMHRSKQFVLLGEMVSAAECSSMGLVDFVVPKRGLRSAVENLTARLLKKSAATLRIAKRALHEGSADFDSSLKKIEDLYLDQLVVSPDMKEGVDAFIEKRSPEWKND